MALFSLLYASISTIPAGKANSEAEAIVDVGRSRNSMAGVTGCLLFGGGRFAQILEGEQASVTEIMDSILRDSRHRDVKILEQGDIVARRFDGWALGYAGSSLFVERTIAKPVSEALRGSQPGIADLVAIMVAFRAEQ